jgi:anti-sigma factor RsiW
MNWLSKHARLRDQLSPYLDGALDPAERASLERHLSTCEACRAELDELRLTVAATRELPEVDAPRSFALTPQMLERRSGAAAPSLPPLALGMRLASAGVAVALAVVVIGDLSDGGAGRGGDGAANLELADESRTTMEFAAEAERDLEESEAVVPAPDTTDSAQADAAQPPVSDASSAAGSDGAACPPVAAAEPTAGGAGGAGSGAGGGAGGPVGSTEATPIAQPSATPTSDVTGLAATGCEAQPIAGGVVPTSSEPAPDAARDTSGEAESAQGSFAAEDDGGVSTLRVLEIVLGCALSALLAGIALELALRRRRTV